MSESGPLNPTDDEIFMAMLRKLEDPDKKIEPADGDVVTRIVLDRVATGLPEDGDFRVEQGPLPVPGANEMLLQTRYLSLDPYMRFDVGNRDKIGQLLTGEVVSEVVESHADGFTPGDVVVGNYGWQTHAIARPTDHRLYHVDPELAPISTAVGVTGMPGQTAYFGLLRLGKPRSGETVVVSAASGAVGSVVGQIARMQGCRAIGVAGGRAKCDHVVQELGFDGCVDYKAGNLNEDLAELCPNGIDVYFENVGGAVLDAVIPLLNDGARVPISGFISNYNDTPETATSVPTEVLGALEHPPEFRHFGVPEWVDEFPEATRTLAGWVKEGRLKYRETIVDGIENAPSAFRMLFTGENFGKLLIRVS